MPDSDALSDILGPLFAALFLGGCTASIASPVVSPILLILIVLSAIKLKRFKKLFPFLFLGLIIACIIAIVPYRDFSQVEWIIVLLIPGLGIGFITRTENFWSIWSGAIRVLVEPIVISFIFGYILLGTIAIIFGLLAGLLALAGLDLTNHITVWLAISPVILVLPYVMGGFLIVALPAIFTKGCMDLYTVLVRYTKYATDKPENRTKMSFHNLYIHFLVWLGAEPPADHEILVHKEDISSEP